MTDDPKNQDDLETLLELVMHVFTDTIETLQDQTAVIDAARLAVSSDIKSVRALRDAIERFDASIKAKRDIPKAAVTALVKN